MTEIINIGTKGQKVCRLYYSKRSLAMNSSHLSLPTNIFQEHFQLLVVWYRYRPRPSWRTTTRVPTCLPASRNALRGIRAVDATRAGCARVRTGRDEHGQRSTQVVRAHHSGLRYRGMAISECTQQFPCDGKESAHINA